MVRLFSLLIFLVPAIGVAAAEEPVHAVLEIKDARPTEAIFEAASRKKPLVLNTAEEAAKHFDEANLALLKKQVDFTKQRVVVFAWKGSGMDAMDFAISDSQPELVQFMYFPGRTRDLRAHVKVYAIRKDVLFAAPSGV